MQRGNVVARPDRVISSRWIGIRQTGWPLHLFPERAAARRRTRSLFLKRVASYRLKGKRSATIPSTHRDKAAVIHYNGHSKNFYGQPSRRWNATFDSSCRDKTRYETRVTSLFRPLELARDQLNRTSGVRIEIFSASANVRVLNLKEKKRWHYFFNDISLDAKAAIVWHKQLCTFAGIKWSRV